MQASSRRIDGLYDLAKTRGALGPLLILIQELAIQRHLARSETSNVVLWGRAESLLGRSAETASLVHVDVLESIAGSFVDIGECLIRSQIDVEAQNFSVTGTNFWPRPIDIEYGRHSYDTTVRIQRFFLDNKFIPRLVIRPELTERIGRYVSTKSSVPVSVAVHLKYNPGRQGESNAALSVWLQFLTAAAKYPVHFFLIGKDKLPAEFSALPNVSLSNDLGLRANDDLALIQYCDFFMGMMSGPSNLAIFGNKPYLIFKNPDHHKAEMIEEIGEKDMYVFASPCQWVLREWETLEILQDRFLKLLSQSRK